MDTPNYPAIQLRLDHLTNSLRDEQRMVRSCLRSPDRHTVDDRTILKALAEAEQNIHIAHKALIHAAYQADQIGWKE